MVLFCTLRAFTPSWASHIPYLEASFSSSHKIIFLIWMPPLSQFGPTILWPGHAQYYFRLLLTLLFSPVPLLQEAAFLSILRIPEAVSSTYCPVSSTYCPSRPIFSIGPTFYGPIMLLNTILLLLCAIPPPPPPPLGGLLPHAHSVP